MHSSGLQVSQELREAFIKAGETSTGIIKLTIQDEKFVTQFTGEKTGNLAMDFQTVKGILDRDAPSFTMIKSEEEKRWILIFYVPERAQVKQKMLFASSRGALKEGLGSASFTHDFYISTNDECTLDMYEKSRRKEAGIDVMTQEEIAKKEAERETRISADNVKMAAIADIPIKVSDQTKSSLQRYSSGDLGAVFLALDSETEILNAEVEGKATAKDIADKLPANAPKFVLFRFTHDFEGKRISSNVFIYYCPEIAKPREKMFFSSTKSMVLKLLEGHGIVSDSNIECSSRDEVNDQALINDIHPRTVEKKAFSKPKPQGKGKARLHAKFTKE